MDLRRPDFLRSGAENPHLDLPRPSAETIFFLYIGEKIFCARARRIHVWIYCARIFCARARRIHIWIARKRYFFSIQGRKFSALGRRESTFGSTAPERGNDIFSLYRGENFLRSGAENHHLHLLRPSAETIYFLYIGEKIFCARARRIHLWIYRARIFCARARKIHLWIKVFWSSGRPLLCFSRF